MKERFVDYLLTHPGKREPHNKPNRMLFQRYKSFLKQMEGEPVARRAPTVVWIGASGLELRLLRHRLQAAGVTWGRGLHSHHVSPS